MTDEQAKKVYDDEYDRLYDRLILVPKADPDGSLCHLAGLRAIESAVRQKQRASDLEAIMEMSNTPGDAWHEVADWLSGRPL